MSPDRPSRLPDSLHQLVFTQGGLLKSAHRTMHLAIPAEWSSALLVLLMMGCELYGPQNKILKIPLLFDYKICAQRRDLFLHV